MLTRVPFPIIFPIRLGSDDNNSSPQDPTDFPDDPENTQTNEGSISMKTIKIGNDIRLKINIKGNA